VALIRKIGVPHSRGAAARLFVRAVVIGAALLLAPSVGEAAVARPINTQATFNVTVSTPGGDIGPFATTQPVTVAVDANGGTHIGSSLVTFTPLGIVLNDSLFSVELVPSSDLLANVNPATGDGAFGATFTMLWHEEVATDGTCSVGPFAVHAATGPTGTSPYSRASGAVTMLDAAPSIPEASGCQHADSINAALALPTTPAAAPPGTVPNPAVTVGATFSPAIQTAPAPPPPPTTTTPKPRPSTPGATPSTAPQVQLVPPAPTTAARTVVPAPRRRFVERVETRSTRKTTTTTSTTVDTSLNGIRNVVPFPDVGSGSAGSANGPRPRNSAIDPVPASSSGPSMYVLLVGAALVIAAVSFALGLIGRDVRRLVPHRRARRTLGGPISPAPLPPGNQPPNELPWQG